MAEEPKEKKEQEYQFINEKIVPKRKSKWKKRLLSVLFTIVLAVIFGLTAQLTILLAGEPLKKLLGMEESGRQEVNLPQPTPSSRPTLSLAPTNVPVSPKPLTSTPRPTPTPVPPEATVSPEATISPELTLTPEITVSPEVTASPEVTVSPEVTLTPEPTGLPSSLPENVSPEPTKAAESMEPSYVEFYEKMTELAEETMKSLVMIEAVEVSVDWFQETYKTRTSMTGLILATDGVDLLILTEGEKLVLADLIEVRLGDSIVEGRIFSSDSNYGLAVVAVALESIPTELLEEVQIGKISSESQIRLGSPVIALGAPNGYDGSIEFGMVTSVGSSVSVTDGQVPYFTTNLTDYAQGYGFIVNLNGEVLGMLTHTHKINADDGVSSAISLDALRGIIVKLLNASDIAYFGIQGEDLPAALQQASGIKHGVYVRGVENASPALAAGIKMGDVLIRADGNELFGIRDFTKVLLAAKEREVLKVTLLRTTGEGVREVVVDVTLTKKSIEQ